MNATILSASSHPFEMNISFGYVIGAIIALFILVYLVYVLIKPDKF